MARTVKFRFKRDRVNADLSVLVSLVSNFIVRESIPNYHDV